MADSNITWADLLNESEEISRPVPAGVYDGVVSSVGTGVTQAKGTPFVHITLRHDPMGDHSNRSHRHRIYVNNPYGVRDLRRVANDFGSGDEFDSLDGVVGSTEFMEDMETALRELIDSEEVTFRLRVKEPDDFNDAPYNEVVSFVPRQ